MRWRSLEVWHFQLLSWSTVVALCSPGCLEFPDFQGKDGAARALMDRGLSEKEQGPQLPEDLAPVTDKSLDQRPVDRQLPDQSLELGAPDLMLDRTIEVDMDTCTRVTSPQGGAANCVESGVSVRRPLNCRNASCADDLESASMNWVPVHWDFSLQLPQPNQVITDEVDGARSFYLSQREVSVAQYKRCVDDGACAALTSEDEGCTGDSIGEDANRYPVNCVSWAEAHHFCRWAGGEGTPGRLPGFSEWLFAAYLEQHEALRMGNGPRWTYPWGSPAVWNSCQNAQWGMCTPREVIESCRFDEAEDPTQRDGARALCDMLGNLQEWLLDLGNIDELNPAGDPYCPDLRCLNISDGERLTIGGDYSEDDVREFVLGKTGAARPATFRSSRVGFRCLWAPLGSSEAALTNAPTE